MIVFYVISFIFFSLFLFIGILLILNKKKNIKKKQNNLKKKYDKNVLKSNTTNSYNNYSLSSNFKIWKYSSDACAEYRKYNIVYVVLIIVVAMVFIFISSILMIDSKYKAPISLSIVVLSTAFLTFFARKIGVKSNSMLLSFVYDNTTKKMYMFNYDTICFQYFPKHYSITPEVVAINHFYNTWQTSRAIEYINKNKIIEKILENGEMLEYGDELIKVSKLNVNSKRCKFKAVFRIINYKEYKRSIIIPSSYSNFDELVDILKRIEILA